MLIDKDKNRWKYIFKGFLTIFLYFFISLIKPLPFILMHINVNDIPENAKNLYSLIVELILIITIISIYEKEFKLAIDDIKKNHNEYFDKYFKVYLIGLIVMIGSNILINHLGGGISNNEESIRNQFSQTPIFVFISAVFLAPILEESVFRLGIYSIIKNKIIYIFISGLIFGGLHLIGAKLNLLFPLYLVSYCAEGWAFAYMNAKTNNSLVSTAFHFMHNGIIMSLNVFLMIFS